MRSIKTVAVLTMASVLSLAVASDTFPKVSLTKTNGQVVEVYIVHHHYDTIGYSLDREGQQRAQFSTKEVAHIDYPEVSDNNLVGGIGAISGKRFDRAFGLLKKAITSVDYEYERVEAYQQLARAHKESGDLTEAIKALDNYIAKMPQSFGVPDALFQQGSWLLEAGNIAEASKRFAQLEQLAAKADPNAKKKAQIGKAEVLKAQGKSSEALAVFQKLRQPYSSQTREAYATIEKSVVELQLAAGQADQAVKTLEAMRFQPIERSDQAWAHAELAKLLQSQGDLIAAYDSAVLAVMLGNPEARAVAKDLAKAIMTDQSVDKSIRDDVKVNSRRL